MRCDIDIVHRVGDELFHEDIQTAPDFTEVTARWGCEPYEKYVIRCNTRGYRFLVPAAEGFGPWNNNWQHLRGSRSRSCATLGWNYH